jgi:hypothetical protein
MSSKPWKSLQFVSKIEIVPGPGNKDVRVQFEEEQEIGEWYGSGPYVTATFRKLHLTNETIKIHHDYPDEFKKLVAFYHGDYENAYDVYKALQKPVPANWETCNKDGEYDCDC